MKQPEKMVSVNDFVDFNQMQQYLKSKDGKDIAELDFVLCCGGDSGDTATDDYECIKLLTEGDVGKFFRFSLQVSFKPLVLRSFPYEKNRCFDAVCAFMFVEKRY